MDTVVWQLPKRCAIARTTLMSDSCNGRTSVPLAAGEQELIRRTGCLHLGAFRFKRAGADVDAPRSSSGTFMSHRSPAADTRDCISSALRDAADQLRLPRYFLLRAKIVVSRIRTNGRHDQRVSRAETGASPTDIGQRTACGITSFSSQELGAVLKPRRSDHVYQPTCPRCRAANSS